MLSNARATRGSRGHLNPWGTGLVGASTRAKSEESTYVRTEVHVVLFFLSLFSFLIHCQVIELGDVPSFRLTQGGGVQRTPMQSCYIMHGPGERTANETYG